MASLLKIVVKGSRHQQKHFDFAKRSLSPIEQRTEAAQVFALWRIS